MNEWMFIILAAVGIFVNTDAQTPTQYVRVGTRVNIQCKPTSTKPEIPTSYRWYSPNNVQLSVDQDLVIENFGPQHEGTYTCRATQIIRGQEASSQSSVDIRLERQSGETTIPIVVAPSYSTFANGIIFLQCKVDGDASIYSFEWILPDNSRSPSATFFKNNVGPNQSGLYTCRVTRKSDNVAIEASTNVIVQQIPVSLLKVSGEAKIGNSVELKCEVDKSRTDNKVFGAFMYTWLDPRGTQISNDPTINIKFDDSFKFGTYTCKVTAVGVVPPYIQEQRIELKQVGGSGGGGTRVPQTGTSSISFVTKPSPFRYFEPLELMCEVNPPLFGASYKILLNGKDISSTNSYFIPRLEKGNQGIYECLVTGTDPSNNQFVELRTTYQIQPTFVTVTKIELTEPPGPQIFVRTGDKRELHCEIPSESGLRGKQAEWYFKGQPLTPEVLKQYNSHILPRMLVSILVLRSIIPENEGKYECKIRGQVKEAYVIVMARTRSIEVNPEREDRKVGDDKPVEFHCRIDGYTTKNKDVIWTFMSKETGQTGPLAPHWLRQDDKTADETSFITINQAVVSDSGTYICTEPITSDSARAVLNVVGDLRIVVTPPLVKLRVGQTAIVQCYVLNSGRSMETPEFVFTDGRSANSVSRASVQTLEAGRIQLTYKSLMQHENGTQVTCRLGRQTANAVIMVEHVCTAGFRLCRNGECVNAAKFCDGKRDCSDGSDEDQQFCRVCDPLSKQCLANNEKSPAVSTYQVHWECDGEDDCGNGYDESQCFGNVLTCGGLNYRCMDGVKTIPKAFVCDKDNDCPNNDDENQCLAPNIISEPSVQYQVTGRKGETITLRCEAQGYPLARIIWRFNWGCLPDTSRMHVSERYENCRSTVSTLTISNIQPGDDGIYNCEALSAGKRAWSRDYQVLVNLMSVKSQ